MHTETSSLRTLKIMPRDLKEIDFPEFGLWACSDSIHKEVSVILSVLKIRQQPDRSYNVLFYMLIAWALTVLAVPLSCVIHVRV
jgi:hypothetical protein